MKNLIQNISSLQNQQRTSWESRTRTRKKYFSNFCNKIQNIKDKYFLWETEILEFIWDEIFDNNSSAKEVL